MDFPKNFIPCNLEECSLTPNPSKMICGIDYINTSDKEILEILEELSATSVEEFRPYLKMRYIRYFLLSKALDKKIRSQKIFQVTGDF